MWIKFIHTQAAGDNTTASVCDGGYRWFVYASGFVQGDESDTIFVVYGSSVYEVDPSNGDVIGLGQQLEYAPATIQGLTEHTF